MRQPMVRLLLSLAAASYFAGAFTPAIAQETAARSKSEGKLKISGSIRMRYEAIEGQPRTGFNASDDLLNFRTRLAAEYDAGAWKIGGELMDSRAYLHDAGTPVGTTEVNTLEPVQAYVIANFGHSAAGKASIQAGRFTLNLGSRRLIASDDFRNTTNSYTGLKVDSAWANGVSVTGVYVLPDIRLPMDSESVFDNETELDRSTTALSLWGGLITAPFGFDGAALQPSYFHLSEDDQADLPTRNRDLATFALRYFRDPKSGAFDFDVEYGVQTGTIRASTAANAAQQDVRATFAHAELGYSWNRPWKPRLAFEYDWASGDEPGGAYNRFDTLFGTRRAEISPSGILSSVGRTNLSAPGLRVEIAPSPRWDAFATWKLLYLASATDSFATTGVRDPTGNSGNFAGNQFDVRFRYWIVPQRLRLETTFAYIAKGEFLRDAPNAPQSGDTKYAAFDLTASF